MTTTKNYCQYNVRQWCGESNFYVIFIEWVRHEFHQWWYFWVRDVILWCCDEENWRFIGIGVIFTYIHFLIKSQWLPKLNSYLNSKLQITKPRLPINMIPSSKPIKLYTRSNQSYNAFNIQSILLLTITSETPITRGAIIWLLYDVIINDCLEINQWIRCFAHLISHSDLITLFMYKLT